MFLIVGLGNPEKDYSGTRHNVGFEAVKHLANENGIKISKAKHRAFLGEGFISGHKVVLAMPQTYMNLSGESVRDLMAYFKLGPESLIVIYDDTDIPLGSVRIREKGSAGGHNGVKNILYHLETDEFLRVKIGIGEKPPHWDLADFVLSAFRKEETDDIIAGIRAAAAAAEFILREGPAAAMNRFNRKAETGENQ